MELAGVMAPTVNPINGSQTTTAGAASESGSGVVLSCSWAESGPNWTAAADHHHYGLNVHSYFFACCFSLIVCLAVITIIRTLKLLQKRQRLGVSLHALLVMSAIGRGLVLFVDPYGLRGLLPCPLNVIVWSLGWPGVISSYTIFFLAVLETTKLSIAPPRFQRLSVLAVIIAISIAYVLFTDLLLSFRPSAVVALLICEIVFIVWGLALTTGFAYVWWKIRKNLSASCPQSKQGRRRSSIHGSAVACDAERRRLNRLIAIFVMSAVVCLILTLTHVVPVINLSGVGVIGFAGRPWHWIAFQTGQRALEVIMCLLIILAMKKPSNASERKNAQDKKKIFPRSALGNGVQCEGIESPVTLSKFGKEQIYSVDEAL